MTELAYRTEDDGVTHINAYSQSRSPLGRQLSNFAASPFECEDGSFQSIEGYWYWLGVGEEETKRDVLRTLVGFKAKQVGRDLQRVFERHEPRFEEKIRAALTAKFSTHAESREALVATHPLPVVHYYADARTGKQTWSSKYDWVWEHISNIRTKLVML